MITIHHLGVSQSDRIVWLMEELNLPYELKWYDRGADFLAPPDYRALHPVGTAPIITDGPFAEGAEVAGGYHVFEAENLDEALALARDIPAAKYGGVEVWPMVHFSPARAPLTSAAASRCC